MSDNTRILIVDDDESLVRLVKGLLVREGYAVLTAYDGAEGLAKAQQEKPDLIILDIEMPELDGYTVAKRLQENAATAAIPILLLTKKGQVDEEPSETRDEAYYDQRIQERLAGFDAGAVEFLSKPAKASELVERVKSLLWLGSV